MRDVLISIAIKMDLAKSTFTTQRKDKGFLMLTRRILDKPICDNVFPLVDMDYPAESYTSR